MKILCVDQYATLGGGQRCLLDLLPSFLNRGWQVSVLAPGPGPLQDAVENTGIAFHSLRTHAYSSVQKPAHEWPRYALETARVAQALLRAAWSERSEVLYVTGPRYLPAAALVSRMLGKRLVYHCHHRLTQQSAIKAAAASLQLSRAQVIACSRYAVQPLSEAVKELPVRVVYNGIAPVSPRTSLPSPIRHIAVIGRVEPEKGQLDFIKAVRLLSPLFPDCRFSVIGAAMFSGADYEGRVRAEAHGLPVHFPGWADNVPAVLLGVDVLAVPSTNLDATPRVILEAFSAGVPVVALPAGGIPELIQDGVNGFLARDGSPEALAGRIAQVVRLPLPDLLRVVRQARQAWLERHSLASFQHAVCAVLDGTAFTNSSHRRDDSPAGTVRHYKSVGKPV